MTLVRFTALAAGSISLLLASCASTEPLDPSPRGAASDPGSALRTQPEEGTRYLTAVDLPYTDAVYLPDWVVNPTLDGVLGSVGVAGPNDLGTTHQLDGARASARLEIARMLEVRVQDVGRRDIEQHLQVGADGLEDRGSSKSLMGVDRNISDLVLAGSRQRALWFDPTSGDCYVWMVMDGAIQKRADHYVENGVSVYVANTPVTSEFRPERPKQVVEPAPAPAPAAPEPPKEPLERLESRLKPIEVIPVKGSGDGQ